MSKKPQEPRVDHLDQAVFTPPARELTMETASPDEQLIVGLRDMIGRAEVLTDPGEQRATRLDIAQKYHTIATGIKDHQRRGNYIMALVIHDVRDRRIWGWMDGVEDELQFWRDAGWEFPEIDQIHTSYSTVIKAMQALGKNPAPALTSMERGAVDAVAKVIRQRAREATRTRKVDGSLPTEAEAYEGMDTLVEEAAHADMAGVRALVAEQAGSKESARPLYLKMVLGKGPHGQLVVVPTPGQFFIYDEIEGLMERTRFWKLAMNGSPVTEAQILAMLRGQPGTVESVVVESAVPGEMDDDLDDEPETTDEEWGALARAFES